ncbi:MAG TPA: hypothetical protein VF042_02460 [Gemmatimonadaceae bacterium]
MRFPLFIAACLVPAVLCAQPADSAASPPKVQDNSFLVEEAYNQEAGVVQHIGTFMKRRGSHDFESGFAQEWPLRSIKHQLSYDIPIVRIGSSTGIGDVALNYRYQLRGDGDARVAITPRLSAFLPTGDWKSSRGSGSFGSEAAIALSYVPSNKLAFHSNAAAALFPKVRDLSDDPRRMHEFAIAQSAIFTGSRIIQPLLESVYTSGSEGEEFLLSPGFRAAINFASGLQIVPGIAVPVGIGPSSGSRGVFAYLSIEHPFKR